MESPTPTQQLNQEVQGFVQSFLASSHATGSAPLKARVSAWLLTQGQKTAVERSSFAPSVLLDRIVEGVEEAEAEAAEEPLVRDPAVMADTLREFLASPTSFRVDMLMGDRVRRWFRETRDIPNPAPDVVDQITREALERLTARDQPQATEVQTYIQEEERERIRQEVRQELAEERAYIRAKGLVGVLMGGPLDGRAIRLPQVAPHELVLTQEHRASATLPVQYVLGDLEGPSKLGEAFPTCRYRLLQLSGLTTSIRTYIIEP